MEDQQPTVVLANGFFRSVYGKTAHGLVRDSRRFRIVAVVDPEAAGHDAGALLDGVHRSIPVVGSIAEAVVAAVCPPTQCIVGVANFGGHLPPAVRTEVLAAVDAGLTIVSGLHEYLSDDPGIAERARAAGITLLDIRKPKPVSALHHWTGAIETVKAPRIAVIGTDSAIGKRTTATLVVDALVRAGIRAELIYTGQTGFLQGVARYGFILDATVNDFVAGELEHAIVTCARERSPDVIVIEGQSGLRSPQGPGGPVLIRSAAAKFAILHHMPARTHYLGLDGDQYRLGPLEQEVALVRAYGAEVLAITLNIQGLSAHEAETFRRSTEEQLRVPVVSPMVEGCARLVEIICAAAA